MEKPLELVVKFTKPTGNRANIQKTNAFPYITYEQLENKKLKKCKFEWHKAS